MEGLYKYSYRLRCKSTSALQQNRPEGSTHGNCVICGRWMEHLDEDRRCKTPECNALLQKICIERGHGGQVQEGADIWTLFNPAPIIAEATHWNAEQDSHALENNECSCGRGLKLPRADVCAQCYREGNVAKMLARKKAPKRREQPLRNKIKGLDRLTRK